MLRPFNKENIVSYIKIFFVYIGASLFLSYFAWNLIDKFSSFLFYFIFALVSVMVGMMIMFTASLLNLRKLLPAFEKMAKGNTKVQIPHVWCPVLTSASQAAVGLCEKIGKMKFRRK